MQRWVWIGLVLVVLLVGGGIAAGIIFGDHDHGYEVGRVVTTASGETIVVHDGGPRFFPGFFLFPLFLLLIFGLLFGAFGRRRWGGPGYWSGPGGPGTGTAPGWFDEWHRRAHEGNATTNTGTGTGTGTEPPSAVSPPDRSSS